MKRLLAIELQKIWKNRASRVLTISYFVILSFIALIASINIKIGSFQLHFAEMGIFNFPFIWHFNYYIAASLKFFLAIVIVSMMANEYSYGTLKQNLIDGMSKKEFVLSKFLTLVLFALTSTLFVFIMSIILGFSFSSYTELGITSSIYVLIKRSAFAIGFIFVWFLVEKISYLTLKFDIFNRDPRVDQVYAFMPLESMSNLIVEPFTRLSVIKNIQTAVGDTNAKDYSVHFSSIFIVLVWTSLFIFLTYKIIKKRDL